MILASIEFVQLHYKQTSSLIYSAIALLISIGLTYGAWTQLLPDSLMYLGILSTAILTADLFLDFLPKRPQINWLYLILYVTVPLLCMLLIYNKPYFKELLVGTLLLIWISDIAAYFVGKSIGHHKLMPTISPGKTREGFFGAGMITILSSYLLYNFLETFSFQQWVVIAILAWLLGSIGDLIESKMKRQLNVKDSGSILPGHGGFLDRFDGFIFCLPAVCIFATLIK